MTTLVGTATASGTTVTIPAHQAGDLILIWAMHGGSATEPTVPSPYTIIQAKTNGTVLGTRSGYKIATSSSDTSGTWTNASELCCHVYRPAAGYVLAIGNSKFNTSTTNTVNYPALTLNNNDGTSWVVGFAACGNTSETISTAPSGMTNESSIAGASYAAAGHDTEGGVSSWPSTNVTTTGTAVDSVVNVIEIMSLSAGSIPAQVVQHIGGGANPNTGNTSLSSATYHLPIINPVGAGNCLVLGISFDDGVTVSSIVDNINGTWGAAAVSVALTGNQDSAAYVFPNATAGQTTITVTLSAASLSFFYVITEFSGVATSSPTNGTTSAHGNAPNLAAGSFTPGNNNANGGNLIWAWFNKSESNSGSTHHPTQILAQGSFSLLNANLGDYASNFNQAHACEVYLQATSAAINPSLTSVGDTEPYNSVAVALKISSGAGTPLGSGIKLIGLQSFTTSAFPTSGPFSVQCPSRGNLRVIASDDPAINGQTVTDNEGNIWPAGAAGTGIWYLPNATPNANLMVTMTGGGGDAKLSWRYFDISGAASSPYDSSLANNQSVASVTTFTVSPSPAPSTANGLVLANVGLGAGPGLAVTAPAGAVWILPTYTGETDFDWMNNADITAYLYNSASGSETWTFTITSQAGNSTSGGFIYFKGAPAGPVTVSLAGLSRLAAMAAADPSGALGMSAALNVETAASGLPRGSAPMLGAARTASAARGAQTYLAALAGAAEAQTAARSASTGKTPLTGAAKAQSSAGLSVGGRVQLLLAVIKAAVLGSAAPSGALGMSAAARSASRARGAAVGRASIGGAAGVRTAVRGLPSGSAPLLGEAKAQSAAHASQTSRASLGGAARAQTSARAAAAGKTSLAAATAAQVVAGLRVGGAVQMITGVIRAAVSSRAAPTGKLGLAAAAAVKNTARAAAKGTLGMRALSKVTTRAAGAISGGANMTALMALGAVKTTARALLSVFRPIVVPIPYLILKAPAENTQLAAPATLAAQANSQNTLDAS